MPPAAATPRRIDTAVALTGAAAVLSLGGALAILVRLPAFLDATYLNADAVGAPLTGAAVAAGSAINVPTQTAAAAILFDAATAWVPGHHVLWLAFGLVLGAGIVAVLAICARSVAGRDGVVLTAVAACVPPTVLWKLLMQDNHVTTLFGTALLAYGVVRVWQGRQGLAGYLAIGAVAGVCEVSDPQFLVAGLLPFLAAMLAPRLIRGRGTEVPFWSTVRVAAGVAAGFALTEVALTAVSVHVLNTLPSGFSPSLAPQGMRLTLDGAAWTAGAEWYGDDVPLLPRIAGVALLLIPLLALRVEAHRARQDRRASSLPLAYAAFWTSCEVLLVLALCFTGHDTQSIQAHYMVQVWYAAAATLPLMLRWGRRWSIGAAAAATAFAAHTLLAIAVFDATNFGLDVGPPPAQLAVLRTFLQQHGLTRGFAGYWDAYPITWQTNDAVSAWPALQGDLCDGDDPGALCRYALSADSWYAPQQTRTFVAARSIGCLEQQPSPRYGAPVATYHVAMWTVWVYPYDVSSRFVHAFAPLCAEGFHRKH